jgi:hypothetical protein
MQRIASLRNYSMYSVNSQKYDMKMFLDLNAKVGREDIFKTTFRNKSLHEI